ncbi:hypothetical protein MUY27_02195 [Mucilaginibacter sp. RS28]|uniref:Response regulatory domain-containing protein n=1 Tax=Mucilaginibacter straminoryzae TaxID=2932774 RepID=A0A9X2BA79_9SPHI|nr:hypothetical protein [Mucilaginibacter straminoryzae]MCJ8208502.1 hypothetical protein [Mucilaginibacter straminoryzae]
MKHKVLIVSNDNLVTGLAKSTLQQEGFEVLGIEDDKVIETIVDFKPAVLIIDHTSNQDGGILCRKIKQSDDNDKVPVLLMSPMRELAQAFDQFLADEFIYRPYIMRSLIDKVNKLVTPAEKLPSEN